jgi:D123
MTPETKDPPALSTMTTQYSSVPPSTVTELPFPPLTRAHILNCSYQSWHPKFRSITPKARIIPLTTPFLDWLRADGIRLPFDEEPATSIPRRRSWSGSDTDSGVFSQDQTEDEDEEEDEDPALLWRPLHNQIKATISELGGKVVPKLNWSAPKDATCMIISNSLACTDTDDVYLLLKSSDFITHDLEHAFDGCVDANDEDIAYSLVLRKYFILNPALEFRVFVRNRKIIGICQREGRYYDFLEQLKSRFSSLISDFLEDKIKDGFTDESFVMDVYIPPPHERVWLVDINPWAHRTDPLLFSWWELLTMPDADASSSDSDEEEVEEVNNVDFRLVGPNDPEALNQFASIPYSAHKLPKDVVDASQAGHGGLMEFATKWKEMVETMERQRREGRDI